MQNLNSENKYQISIIVTALNEEANIGNVISNTLAAFEDFNINGEIIVVNDGSVDKTAEIVTVAMSRNNRVTMLSHDTPKGVGASFWDGIDVAGGSVIMWFPGDNQNDPWEILRYYKLLEDVDIVIPFMINRIVRPLFRDALSFIYRLIINTTFFVNFNYTNGTILFRKSVLKEINHRSNGFFVHVDILIRAVKKGYLFAEVPYKIRSRKEGTSTAISLPSLLQVAGDYLRLLKDCYFKKGKNKISFTDDSLAAKRKDDLVNI